MHYSLCEQKSAEYCADPLNLQSEINTAAQRQLVSTRTVIARANKTLARHKRLEIVTS